MDDPFEGSITTRLVIGVTGHRRLQPADVPALEAGIRGFFLELRQRYPDLPLVLLSPLAEGGDRLAAEVAFELGIRVIAPLPLPVAQYRDDFAGDASRAVFERQLARAEPLVLPLRHREDAGATGVDGPARDRQYAEAGMFVSRHCHILLALWDGDAGASLGGTADVVRFHLHGELPGRLDRRRASLTLLGVDENRLIHHLPAGREGAAPLQPARSRWLAAEDGTVGHDALPAAFDGMFRHQAEFNVDSRKYADAIGAAIAAAPDAPSCPIHRLFVATDWLASTYQRRVTRVLRITYAVAAATGAAFILYAHVHSQDAMIYLYLLLFAAGVGLAVLVQRRQWHRKYLDYRALAEGLRVLSYWRRAGMVDAVNPSCAQDNFMQEQDVELGWIRNVMRGASLEGLQVSVPAGAEDDTAEVDRVIEDWVGTLQTGGQLRYFADTAAHRARLHQRAELVARGCLFVGIGISVLLAILAHQLDYAIKTALVVVMGLLSVSAGVHEAYVHKKADKELVKQYRFMQRIYAGARRRLDGSVTLADKRRVLRTLGEAALAEHAEWTLMHRERPLEHTRLG